MASSTRMASTWARALAKQSNPTTAAAARSFSTIPRTARPSVALKLQSAGKVAFRRAYADEVPKRKPGKLRLTFRWAWRLTYLSAAGLVGYGFLNIWQDRHPPPQFEADPDKKTLVILGTSLSLHS